MTQNEKLPDEIQERIEADAERYAGLMVWVNTSNDPDKEPLFHEHISATSYIAGATTEAEKTDAAVDAALHKERNTVQAKMTEMETGYMKQINNLLDVLQKIVHAPVPANDREYMSWFVTAKNIAGGAISNYEAEIEARQWKDGKGKEVENGK